MRDAKLAMFTGKAGEYAVAAQLFLRRVHVLWPAVDTGFDLMTIEGCRVQVKCAHLLSNHPYGPRYHFPLPKMRRMPDTDRTTKLVARKTFVQTCDFVVFWGIEQNRFWIVPASLADSCTGVDLGVDSTLRRFVGSVADMREMLRLGYTQGQVAKHYGIERTSLRQFLDSGRDTIEESVVSQMRSCESRWDFITDFVRPAVVVDSEAKEQSSESL